MKNLFLLLSLVLFMGSCSQKFAEVDAQINQIEHGNSEIKENLSSFNVQVSVLESETEFFWTLTDALAERQKTPTHAELEKMIERELELMERFEQTEILIEEYSKLADKQLVLISSSLELLVGNIDKDKRKLEHRFALRKRSVNRYEELTNSYQTNLKSLLDMHKKHKKKALVFHTLIDNYIETS